MLAIENVRLAHDSAQLRLRLDKLARLVMLVCSQVEAGEEFKISDREGLAKMITDCYDLSQSQ